MPWPDTLALGKVAEGHITRWLRARCGYTVLPVYEVELASGKGPQLFTPKRGLIAPDMLAYRGGRVRWIEAKHKTVFTWHRLSRQWQTGIDRRHWRDYQLVALDSPWPIWILFLHQSAVPDERDLKAKSPSLCPVGLFGNTVQELARRVHHEHDNHGRTGMVYWNERDLRHLASLSEVLEAADICPCDEVIRADIVTQERMSTMNNARLF